MSIWSYVIVNNYVDATFSKTFSKDLKKHQIDILQEISGGASDWVDVLFSEVGKKIMAQKFASKRHIDLISLPCREGVGWGWGWGGDVL